MHKALCSEKHETGLIVVSVCWLSVFLSVFVHFIYDSRNEWWPSAGKELSSGLSACFILCSLNCLYSFPVWCLGQDVAFDCIGSWNVYNKHDKYVEKLTQFPPVCFPSLPSAHRWKTQTSKTFPRSFPSAEHWSRNRISHLFSSYCQVCPYNAWSRATLASVQDVFLLNAASQILFPRSMS